MDSAAVRPAGPPEPGRIVGQVLQLDDLIDGQRLGRFNINLLVWSFLAMVADGFDLAGLASAAPALSRTWHLAPTAFAPALTASLFGMLVGAPLLGYQGDRFGRRTAIIAGCAVYGLGTLATVWAATLSQVAILRFVTGIGLGGLMPNAIALNSELAPKRMRATLIVLMFTGISAGASIPGAVQAWLIPQEGWQIMFWIGGLGPLAIAACLVVALPESVKYLLQSPARYSELLATVRKLRRDLVIADDARFALAPVYAASGSGIAQLVSGQFAWITPLLWICFAGALMTSFFLNSWLPLILEGGGYGPKASGIAISCYHYGGIFGGLLVSVVLRRFGFIAIGTLFVVAGLAVPAIGVAGGVSYSAMVTAVVLSGFCIVGAQFGNNAVAGLLYPTPIRSSGVGSALGVGRLGSIAGPLIGGMLIGRHIPLQQLFIIAAVPMAAGVIASALASSLCRDRFGSVRLDEAADTLARGRTEAGRTGSS